MLAHVVFPLGLSMSSLFISDPVPQLLSCYSPHYIDFYKISSFYLNYNLKVNINSLNQHISILYLEYQGIEEIK